MPRAFSEPNRPFRVAVRNEVHRLRHDYIGTEHILLGLARARPSLARDVLEALEVDPEVIRAEVERHLIPGSTPTPPGQLPFTPRAKEVLEKALEECTESGDPSVDTAHLLVAVVRVGEGIAGNVLFDLGLTVDAVRARSRELRAIEPEPVAGPAADADDLANLRGRLAECERSIDDLRARLESLARRLDRPSHPPGGQGTEIPRDPGP